MIDPRLALLQALRNGGIPNGNMSALSPLLAMLSGNMAPRAMVGAPAPGPMLRVQNPDPREGILRALGGQ